MKDFIDSTKKMDRLNRSETDDIIALAAIGGIGMLSGMLIIVALRGCDKPQVALKADCKPCHEAKHAEGKRKSDITDYFRRNGSKSPEKMAEAVLATRSPRLMAAIAVRESNGNPNARHGGYRNRHDGAWQVNRSIHGRVPLNVTEQALQAELVLEEHVKAANGDIIEGLNAYGGDKSRKTYAWNVLSELRVVP